MQYVHVVNGVVHEIIPEAATQPSIDVWYPAEFAAECVECSDEVQQGWTHKNDVFSAPTVAVDNSAQISMLKAQLEASDYKVIKCYEYSLAGLPAPYDTQELHAERQAIRDQINALETEQ